MAGPLARMAGAGAPDQHSMDFKGSGKRLLAQFRPERFTMYAMILCALPIGVLSLFAPDAAGKIGASMTQYLRGLPDELYALFGTGYLGYTAARQWGKVKGVEG